MVTEKVYLYLRIHRGNLLILKDFITFLSNSLLLYQNHHTRRRSE